jgi:hypothetical protein
VELHDGPDLVLNPDYDGSSVPVLGGVGPLGSTITLVKQALAAGPAGGGFGSSLHRSLHRKR